MSLINEAATNSTGLVAGLSAGVTAGGLAIMQVVRNYFANSKDNAADKGMASAYEMLTAENRRLADQMAKLSLMVNESLSEKLKLMGRVSELERQLHGVADLEKENIELRAEAAELRGQVAQIRVENHELRDRVHTLQLTMEAKG